MTDQLRTSRVPMAIRATVVTVWTTAVVACVGVAASALRVVRGRGAAATFFYRRLVRHIERLGPAYVKFGQIMGTRRDILPERLCDELEQLHDRVRPMPRRAFRTALAGCYGDDLDRLFATVDPEPIASGSIAGVYRAELPDGHAVALKLRRPGIRRRMTLDLAIIYSMSGLGERLPALRGVPARELVGFVCSAILGQLDFVAEREHLEQLGRNFDDLEYTWIPRTLPELSRPGCIVMEYIPDLAIRPVSAIDEARRPLLASRTLQAVYRMLFVDGFVHCDLHPGNVYFRGSKVVILDAGFSVRLPDTVRRQFSDFFLGMALGKGRQCGEVVVESAVSVAPGADIEGFVERVADLVNRNTGLPAKDFHLMSFGMELFTLQRDFGLYAASEFVFPLLSLLVIEGSVRGLDPEIDFQKLARPMLLRAAGDLAYLRPHRRYSG